MPRPSLQAKVAYRGEAVATTHSTQGPQEGEVVSHLVVTGEYPVTRNKKGHYGTHKKLPFASFFRKYKFQWSPLMGDPAARGPYRVRTSITRLAAIREQANLTQIQLAELAGVSSRAIGKHESLLRMGDVWQATQKRLIGLCIKEIERQNRDDDIVVPP
jgi:DNA-binding XRE family transcriptional regulator